MTATEVEARVEAHDKALRGRAADLLIMDDVVDSTMGAAEAKLNALAARKALTHTAGAHVIKGGLPSVTPHPNQTPVYLDASPLVVALKRVGHTKASAAVLQELHNVYNRGYKDAMDARVTISPTPLTCSYDVGRAAYYFNDGLIVTKSAVMDATMLSALHLDHAHRALLVDAHASTLGRSLVIKPL